MKQSLGTPQPLRAPEAAYGRNDVYNAAVDSMPRPYDSCYREYRFLGRLPLSVGSTSAARAAARSRYGRSADVFETARYWVCYELR